MRGLGMDGCQGLSDGFSFQTKYAFGKIRFWWPEGRHRGIVVRKQKVLRKVLILFAGTPGRSLNIVNG